MNWEPAHADHSIDRVVATVTFLTPIDLNTFDELVVLGRKAAAMHLLTDRIDLQEPIEMPPGGRGVIMLKNFTPQRRVAFRRIEPETNDIVDEFSIGMRSVAFGTTRYRRWVNFFQLITDIVRSLDSVSPITQSVKAVRLEYHDRFQSADAASDHFEVIEKTSCYLAPVLASKTLALHVHSGWFDIEGEKIRRLTNVNIDVNDDGPERRLTLLTLGQFEKLDGVLDEPLDRLSTLHGYLKKTFGATITSEAAARVALMID